MAAAVCEEERADWPVWELVHGLHAGEPTPSGGVVTGVGQVHGRQCVFVANDANPNFFYRNLGDGKLILAPASGGGYRRFSCCRLSLSFEVNKHSELLLQNSRRATNGFFRIDSTVGLNINNELVEISTLLYSSRVNDIAHATDRRERRI